MSGIPAVYAVTAAAILWYVISTLAAWYRLRKFPGPTLAKFSYLWAYFAMRTGRNQFIMAEQQEKYGKIMRLGPNELMIYDPETLWYINGARSTYRRGGWYDSAKFDPYGHNILSEPDTVTHDKRKAKVMSGYAGKGNVNIEQKVDSQLALLVDVLRKNHLQEGDNIVDFSKLIRFFQVDLVTLVGSSEPWGDLPTETDKFDFISLADGMVPFLDSFMMVPYLRNFFASSFFLTLAGPKATDKKGMGRFMGLIKGMVEKRFGEDSTKSIEQGEQGDMLTEWIKHGLSRRECEIELAIQVPTGTETTTSGIRAIMLYLLTSPNAYRKLQEEITAGIRDGRISSPISQEQAKQLPYLQAVIYEGLRMVPPAVAGFPKKVPAGGDTICGEFVPAGTDIFVNVYTMLRNKEVFGKDADTFRPERFLVCDPAKKAELIKTVDLIFGHGRWLCPGKTLAWFELNKVFVELLRNFDFQVVNPESPWTCKAYISILIEDFWIRVTERREY
ncbi:cytochrome P450 [Hypoxylon trugodes]|uniref:cytochrome P450 n=1 Tax=Hypoxylon trugodes TaxID=326681 RepID=UPI00218D6103|nr:cytochrome P450 [Hypoxylon trugodes]KAI1383031.1 cytochrome P450 [Hypoxylon trugodes]